MKTKITASNFVANVRAAVSLRDVRGLVRASCAAGPDALVRAWAKLRPVERVAAFRALSPRDAAKAFAALSGDGKWLAYLGEVSEGAAPLLEGVRKSDAKLLRRATRSELGAMRKVLAR